MEPDNSRNSDDDDEGTTTDQIKLKAQEIAKRLEKYQGRYHTSSRCNTPLPITSADSMESILSASAVSDASEKLLLFRQFLENDRKLVEDDKIDERKYSNDDGQANGDELLNIQPQSNDEKENLTYYENIIESQYNEKIIQSLKNQITELNEKLKNSQNVIIEKDVLLQSKIDKIESLSKTISQKNIQHLETVDALKQRNIDIINDERIRFSQKINQVVEETEELKHNLDYIDKKYDELRKSNIKIDKENNELRIQESYLKSEIEQLSLNYKNEKELLKHNLESSEEVIKGMEKEFYNLQQENNLLQDRVSLLESKPINNQENDDLLTKLNLKEDEIQHLNLENNNLNELYKNLKVEVQETENRWTQLKDAYINDKNRMSFLEKVIEELKISNDELSNSNVKLNENLENSTKDLIKLKTENSACNEQIADLMAVIENMRDQFEKALKDSSIEYEHDKKILIQQHENEKSLLINSNNKLEECASKLNNVTDQLNTVLKENDLYKSERLELDSCIGKNNEKISELNNIVNELHNQMSQMANELEILRKENASLSNKLNGTSLELEENKLLSDRFLKQKQLLKVKVKALKESENNCLLLQQKVTSLTEQIQDFNKNSKHLDENDDKISTILRYCDTELKICYELLNNFFTKFDVHTQNMNTLQNGLERLSSLFPLDCFDDDYLTNVINSIANIDLNGNNEPQSCLKKIIMGTIQIFNYIMYLKNVHKLSEAQSMARTEVDKLITEAVEKVKISTENEYKKKNYELLCIIEHLEQDYHMLKLNVDSNTQVLESKEVLTDLHGSTVSNLLSLDILDVENMKNENDTLKQFLKNIHEKLGLVNFEETNNAVLLNSLSELELLVQEIKNENLLLKSQCFEHQKLLKLKPLEQPIDKHSNINLMSASIPHTEIVEDNYGNAKQLRLNSEDTHINQHDTEKLNPTVNSDSKMLLVRYKNLKSKFKDVRAKTVELENKVISLTNDLEFANSKYKQLNDQYAVFNETHEADIVSCQSEIENLMGEKLEAYRQLTALKEKHEILQNDYDQLKSNLDDKIESNNIDSPTDISEQNMLLKSQLNDTQKLIDSAYSKVLCEWPPSDSNIDWVLAQSRKLDDIINAKCITSKNEEVDFDFGDSETKRLNSCVQIIHELVTSILKNKCGVEVPPTNELVDLMSKIKSYTETFLEFVSVQNRDLNLVNERHIELPQCVDESDENNFETKQHLLANEPPFIEHSLPLAENTLKSSVAENVGNEHFQQAIAERDQLIGFLSEKISRLDNLSRNVDNIILIRHKLDKALTAVHERDVRCDELTLELTRLLEERDMLQLKLSNAIRQVQFLSDHKPQRDTSDLPEETYGSKNIDDKLEELHSLEYRRDADLFTDQEQRHKSQMLLHQGHESSSTTQEPMPSNANEEVSTSQSWFKDILSW